MGLVALALLIGGAATWAIVSKTKDEPIDMADEFIKLCLEELDWKSKRPDLK